MSNRSLKMCVINSDLVEDLAEVVGTQSDIMARSGISWNSWIKIVGGLPVRRTVGERFRSQVLDELGQRPSVRSRFASTERPEQIDMMALESAFLTPVEFTQGDNRGEPQLRSVRRAAAFARSARTPARTVAAGYPKQAAI
ncbi:MAG: hypothetical protein ABW128_09540 [Rhizorhabdus sp.]